MLDIDFNRLCAAYEKARDDLLAQRVPAGNWVGELASSALATATAVSALSLVQGSRPTANSPKSQVPSPKSQEAVSGQLSAISSTRGDASRTPIADSPQPDLGLETWALGLCIRRGLDYLASQQNPDGGFGDTDLSHSNVATTMLVRAAFHLAAATGNEHESRRDSPTWKHRELLSRAAQYIDTKGGIAGLRARYGKDKTFAVPILTNCALAGLVDWRQVSPLPFELAAFPQSWYRFFRLPVVSYAIPALVAIGQARYFRLPPRNPLVRALRRTTINRSLKVLEQMQPESGGYLEAIPLTSFVVMSLAGTGRADHPVARRGVQFLLDAVRPDGSWPIDTNLATWVTTLAVNALAERSTAGQASSDTEPSQKSPKSQVPSPKSGGSRDGLGTWDVGRGTILSDRVVEWLLSCQHTERHPFTGAKPGGWGWSDLSGAVPDCDDTAGALLALAKEYEAPFATPDVLETGKTSRDLRADSRQRIERAVRLGIDWLIALQNRDGGWPTFCRGWGALPFDRSSPDLTAHAVRAFIAYRPHLERRATLSDGLTIPPVVAPPFNRIFRRALDYLRRRQRADGSWTPLWFGNQDHPNEENHVYGTSRVLLAYCDLGRMGDDEAVRGMRWLIANQNADGGWGSASPKSQVPSPKLDRTSHQPGTWDLGPATFTESPVLNTTSPCGSSVEETAWAVEALFAGLDNDTLATDNSLQNAIRQGVDWLVRAVEDGRHGQHAPVGFYFAKLWYYEKLYPLAFCVSALGEAVGRAGLPRDARQYMVTSTAKR